MVVHGCCLGMRQNSPCREVRRRGGSVGLACPPRNLSPSLLCRDRPTAACVPHSAGLTWDGDLGTVVPSRLLSLLCSGLCHGLHIRGKESAWLMVHGSCPLVPGSCLRLGQTAGSRPTWPWPGHCRELGDMSQWAMS